MTYLAQALLLAIVPFYLGGCAQLSNEAANWNGTLSYNPSNGRWEVSFSRPGGIGEGKAIVPVAK